MIAVKTEGLTKKYKDLTAVDGLNLEIQKGEIYALLGVNGAGKTTAVKMLSCLLQPTGGEAFLCGKSILKDREEDRWGFTAGDGGCAQSDRGGKSEAFVRHIWLSQGKNRPKNTRACGALWFGSRSSEKGGEAVGRMAKATEYSVGTGGRTGGAFSG